MKYGYAIVDYNGGDLKFAVRHQLTHNASSNKDIAMKVAQSVFVNTTGCWGSEPINRSAWKAFKSQGLSYGDVVHIAGHAFVEQFNVKMERPS